MIKKLTLFLTDDCNMNCEHCYIYLNKHYLDYNVFKNIIKNNWDEVTLTGGEALLHPNIWNIIEDIHRTNAKIRLLTNGVLLNKQTIFRLKDYDVEIFVTYQKNREKILNNIIFAVNNGLKVGINHVLTNEERFALKLLPKDVNSICLIYPTDYGNANVPIYNSDLWNVLVSQTLNDYSEFKDKIIYEPAFIYASEKSFLKISCIANECVTINVFGDQVKCCLLLNANEYTFKDFHECPLIKKQIKLAKNGVEAICPLLLKNCDKNEIW